MKVKVMAGGEISRKMEDLKVERRWSLETCAWLSLTEEGQKAEGRG